jgi:hypothetical protein
VRPGTVIAFFLIVIFTLVGFRVGFYVAETSLTESAAYSVDDSGYYRCGLWLPTVEEE